MLSSRTAMDSSNFIHRKDFGKIPVIVDIPNLIEVQKRSYDRFLQRDKNPDKRENRGLEEVFRSVFPITNYKESASIEYMGYEVGIWECRCGEYKGLGGEGVVCEKCKTEVVYKEKYSMDECHQKGMTYADPLKILVQLVVKEKDEKGKSTIREIKHQPQQLRFLGHRDDGSGLLTSRIERVIVSQM